MVFQNAGTAPLAAGVATFGETFQKGEIPAGSTVTVLHGSTTLPVQMDVKSRYEDGSVKMAVLAVDRPALAAGASYDMVLKAAAAQASAPAALDMAKGLNGHSFTVALDMATGPDVTVDVVAALRTALKDGTASFWQKGPLTTEARVEIDLPGSMRGIFDVSIYKGGGFAVDMQLANDQAMQASGGRTAYTATVTMDGRQVAKETLDQGQYQTWHEGFSATAKDGGQGLGSPSSGWLNIRHDVAHMQDAGAVANYDLSLKLDDSLLKEFSTETAAAGWGAPLAANDVTKYMPAAGGRDDIGFTTESNTAWLISQDARAAAHALGQAEAAAAVPWHFWDEANDTWLNTDAYPKLWVDGRGGTGKPGDAKSTGLTQQVDSATGWTMDSAHQPDLSSVPYLMTGERWILDNLQAQASWSIMTAWPAYRLDATDLVVNGMQVRSAAWALRQVDAAAELSPDGSKEKAFFQAASESNWKWLVSKIPEWTAQQGEAHGWVPGDYGIKGALPPWQQDYFASTALAAARAGNADALTFLEWQSNFLVGRFNAADEGFDLRDGAAYLIAISDPATGRLYTTWEEMGAKTEAQGWSNGEQGWAKSNGDYAQLALATLGGIWELTGSAEARDAYQRVLATAPPFTKTADYGTSRATTRCRS
ncbi:MAG: hypothetical protein B7Z53_02145 [Rhodospirillales bacterium 12-71-4]|nr:MAG: hypothetical protein B7Z53_02145 [Rhodospirillales bacterium 12-71-4]